jgi:hypothetical protein
MGPKKITGSNIIWSCGFFQAVKWVLCKEILKLDHIVLNASGWVTSGQQQLKA